MPYFDDSITSPRLLGLTRRCPECGDECKATGTLLHAANPYSSSWSVDFHCAREDLNFRLNDPGLGPIIQSILAEHGKT